MNRKIMIVMLLAGAGIIIFITLMTHSQPVNKALQEPPVYAGIEWPWEAPDTAAIPHTPDGDLVRYGRQLVSQTAYYLGPEGTVTHISNGLNCQNCHLEAGTRPWGNNYGAVAATYPKYRERSGTVESIEKKINDCFERSMNGGVLDSNSREMRAMVAYMHWLGKEVPKGKKPLGSGLTPPPYLDRAADTVKGRQVYIDKCQRCHGADGGGLVDTISGIGYTYPPLWGDHSYNIGAGIYRVAKFASYVKHNMPFGVRFGTEELTDEESWDVAAFVNSQPRPHKNLDEDWPDIKKKPVDHPFGPFTDSFTEQQHKYGPYGPIEEMKKKKIRNEK